TDPALRGPDDDPVLRYRDLPTDAAPTTPASRNVWSADCRILINCEHHIRPPPNVPTIDFDTDGVTIIGERRCTVNGCHIPVGARGATGVPAAQLDLSDGLSPDQMDHFNSYRELLFTDNEQELVGGALQDRLVENGVDENGNPILVTVPVAPPMSAAGAAASPRFFSRFDPGGSHEGYLSDAELRLIAEWLDLGAQYYNNPFDVPQE